MNQEKYTSNKEKKKHHLTERDRYKIEALLKAKVPTKEIAKIIGCSQRTIQREIKRGKITQLTSMLIEITVYKADYGQRIHEENGKNKGRELKIGKSHEYANRITELILFEKYSPDAANAQWIKENNGEKVVCTRTLYNYIYSELFIGVSAKQLPRGERKTGKKKKHKKVALNNINARSIEERTKDINERTCEGHWEMDTVVSSQTKRCLLVLTERKTNLELVVSLSSRTASAVREQFDRWEKQLGFNRFRTIFKSITCDNGGENLDTEGLERSIITKGRRTIIYYAHPYSAYERGSNEVANVLIRRFIPKKAAANDFKKSEVKKVQTWMNDYPRKKHNYNSAFEVSEFAPILQKFGVI